MRLTLWGKQAETFDHNDSPVIAFKGVKVGDFGGRSLSMFSTATMSVNPDIEETHSLRGWYDTEGAHQNFTAYTNAARTDNTSIRPDELKDLGQVKDENLGANDKPDYFSTSATVSFVKKESFAYPACASEGCNKKVVDDGSGWLCEKCNQKWPEPIYRYILHTNIMDHAGSIWTTLFNDEAEKLMGISANELTKLRVGRAPFLLPSTAISSTIPPNRP